MLTAVPGGSFSAPVGVEGGAIAASTGANVADVLKDAPGVGGSTFAAGANRPILRGQDNNRVSVTENSIGSGDVSALSEDHAVPFNPCAPERVEVLHGPATLRYGGAAIGGVIESHSETVPTRMLAGGISGEIRGGLTSVDRGRDGCFKTSAAIRGIVVQASAFGRHSDDYATPGGRQANTFVDSSGYSLGGSYVWSDGFVGAAYTRSDSSYGIPGTEAAAARERIDLGQDKVTARAEWRARRMGIATIRTWLGHSDYAHNEVFAEAGTGADTIGSRFLNKQLESRTELEHMPVATMLGTLSGTAGLYVDSRDMSGLSSEGDNLLEPNRTRKTAGYLLEELHWSGPLRLLGGVRLEQARVQGAFHANLAAPDGTLVSFERTFHLASGSFGARYDFPLGVTARVTTTYAERAPEAQELFSKGAHEATGTFEIGNPDLTKEAAGTVEIGLDRKSGSVRFNASVFATRYHGYIFRQLTGDTCGETLVSCIAGPGEELKKAIFGQRDARFQGVEFKGELDVARVWRGVWGLSGQYDRVSARFDSGEHVPRIPPQRLGGGLFYRDAALLVRVALLHAFAQTEIGANETSTTGYSMLNAELSYTLPLTLAEAPGREITIGLKGENLLDDDVRNHASFKKDEVLQPGRTVRAFGVMKF